METKRCKEHPEFDPYIGSQFKQEKYLGCATCCGLHYGAQCMGHFPGESVANKNDMANAIIRLGPMSLEQFGHVRYSLGHDFHMGDGPPWYANTEDRTIYFDRKITEFLQKKLVKEYDCKVIRREWTEPEITSIKMEKEEGIIIMTFGNANNETVLNLKRGMTILTVRNEMWRFMTKLNDISKENIVETAVEKK